MKKPRKLQKFSWLFFAVFSAVFSVLRIIVELYHLCLIYQTFCRIEKYAFLVD